MSKLNIEFTGKVIDVGDLREGRGAMLEVAGEEVCITGLTEEETKAIGRFLCQRVTVTIAASQTEAPK